MSVTVIIPTLNPPTTLRETVGALQKAGFTRILLADSGSIKQESHALLQQLGADARCVWLPCGEAAGRGKALKKALRYFAQHQNGDCVVVTLEDNGGNSAQDAVRCVQALTKAPQSLIVGMRNLAAAPQKLREENAQTVQALAKHGWRIQDALCGARAFQVALIPELAELDGDGFAWELRVLQYAFRHGIPVQQVPVSARAQQRNDFGSDAMQDILLFAARPVAVRPPVTAQMKTADAQAVKAAPIPVPVREAANVAQKEWQLENPAQIAQDVEHTPQTAFAVPDAAAQETVPEDFTPPEVGEIFPLSAARALPIEAAESTAEEEKAAGEEENTAEPQADSPREQETILLAPEKPQEPLVTETELFDLLRACGTAQSTPYPAEEPHNLQETDDSQTLPPRAFDIADTMEPISFDDADTDAADMQEEGEGLRQGDAARAQKATDLASLLASADFDGLQPMEFEKAESDPLQSDAVLQETLETPSGQSAAAEAAENDSFSILPEMPDDVLLFAPQELIMPEEPTKRKMSFAPQEPHSEVTVAEPLNAEPLAPIATEMKAETEDFDALPELSGFVPLTEMWAETEQSDSIDAVPQLAVDAVQQEATLSGSGEEEATPAPWHTLDAVTDMPPLLFAEDLRKEEQQTPEATPQGVDLISQTEQPIEHVPFTGKEEAEPAVEAASYSVQADAFSADSPWESDAEVDLWGDATLMDMPELQRMEDGVSFPALSMEGEEDENHAEEHQAVQEQAAEHEPNDAFPDETEPAVTAEWQEDKDDAAGADDWALLPLDALGAALESSQEVETPEDTEPPMRESTVLPTTGPETEEDDCEHSQENMQAEAQMDEPAALPEESAKTSHTVKKALKRAPVAMHFSKKKGFPKGKGN